MYSVCRKIEFCYGHRLLGYQGKCANLHGHNAIVEIEISGVEVNAQGLLIDFSKIKEIIEAFVIKNLDHRMILIKDDPWVKIMEAQNEKIYVMDEAPSAENMAKLIFNYAMSKKLAVSEVRFWESSRAFASYRGGNKL